MKIFLAILASLFVGDILTGADGWNLIADAACFFACIAALLVICFL